MRTHDYIVVLMKKIIETQNDNVIYVPVPHDVKFTWVPWVMGELQKSKRVVLVSDRQPYCGLFGKSSYKYFDVFFCISALLS